MTRAMTPLDLAISEIDASCQVWEVTGGRRAAWLELSGVCCGARDAMWIQWQIDAAVQLGDCSALVLDLRELRNPTNEPFAVFPRHRQLPVLVVGSDVLACIPPDLFRTDLEAARTELEQILRTPRPRRERERATRGRKPGSMRPRTCVPCAGARRSISSIPQLPRGASHPWHRT